MNVTNNYSIAHKLYRFYLIRVQWNAHALY